MKWLQLSEYCFSTMYHMSIQMTPFMALYGYDAPSFLDLLFSNSRVPGARDLLQENWVIMRSLKENMYKAHNKQHRMQINKEWNNHLKWVIWFISCRRHIDSLLLRGVVQKI